MDDTLKRIFNLASAARSYQHAAAASLLRQMASDKSATAKAAAMTDAMKKLTAEAQAKVLSAVESLAT